MNHSLDMPPSMAVKGMEISVGHLSYSIFLTQTGRWKRILNDVSLQLQPNTLTALMGPSGSGKR
jgi:ABC-type multidrug transport system ATPase subunit